MATNKKRRTQEESRRLDVALYMFAMAEADFYTARRDLLKLDLSDELFSELNEVLGKVDVELRAQVRALKKGSK